MARNQAFIFGMFCQRLLCFSHLSHRWSSASSGRQELTLLSAGNYWFKHLCVIRLCTQTVNKKAFVVVIFYLYHRVFVCICETISGFKCAVLTGQRSRWTGRGPTGWRARGRNRRQLENRSHVVPKTEFEDGSDRTWIFTHKMIILAQFILKVGHPGITCEQPISCARYAWLHSSTWGALVGGLNSVQIRHFWNRTVKQTSCTIDLARNGNSGCAN